jgi:hypothetical protein
MSVRPSVRPSVRMYKRGSHWTDFREIRYCDLNMKLPREIQDMIKIGQKYRCTLQEYVSTFYCCQQRKFVIIVPDSIF